MTIREKIEELARKTFEEITGTEAAALEAEKRRNETPKRKGLGLEYEAKAAAAEAKYQEAKTALIQMRFRLPERAEREMQHLRAEYEREILSKFQIDPAKLDMASLELLRSGIMRPSDYKAMLDNAQRAGNVTLARMVSKYAGDQAAAIEAKNGAGDPDAQALRYVHYAGKADPAETAMQNFDRIADTFKRCVNNPAMIKHWEGLAEPVLEML